MIGYGGDPVTRLVLDINFSTIRGWVGAPWREGRGVPLPSLERIDGDGR